MRSVTGWKGDASPVTQVDRAIEAMCREQLAAWHPDHGIVGEEFEAVRPGAGATDERWTALRGGVTRCQSGNAPALPCRTSGCTDLGRARLATTSPDDFDAAQATYSPPGRDGRSACKAPATSLLRRARPCIGKCWRC